MTGNDIKEIRRRAGWTQYHMADFLAVSQPMVNRAERLEGESITVGALATILYQSLIRELDRFIDGLPRGSEIGKPAPDVPFTLEAVTPKGGIKRVVVSVQAIKGS